MPTSIAQPAPRAQDGGPSPGGILVPIPRPALLAAFVLMFITLLNDYDPAVFLQKPGTEIIGVTMLQYFQQGVLGPVAALAVVQVVIVAVVLALRLAFHRESAACLRSVCNISVGRSELNRSSTT